MNDTEKIAALETKVATLEGRAPFVEASLKAHEGKINGLTQRLNERNLFAAEAGTRLVALEERVHAHDLQWLKSHPKPGPSRASRAWSWLKENRPPVKDLVLWVLIAVMFAGMVVMFFELRDRPPGPAPGPVPPPEPIDSLWVPLKTAWAQESMDAKTLSRPVLASLYEKSVAYANDPGIKKVLDLKNIVKTARANMIGEALPHVREVLNAESNRVLPTLEDAPLDATTRALCAKTFTRYAELLRRLP
jgi:hypothetical protein